MTIHVKDILAQASANKDQISPIDIVMGEHWGEINLGNSLRLSLLKHILQKQDASGKFGSSGSNQSKLRLPLQVAGRSPQALVKVIKNGGTTNARGMRDQMSYLEKDGDSKLERSERYFGTVIDREEQEALIDAWGLTGESKTNSDKTTHFVVSFPAGTDHDAAYRAGRAWAEALFAKGTYGDVFDYYTAFHTDKAHPHIHVVVNRRGMENGDWLKVSKRSQFNYDEFRAVQVEVANLEGIYLEATPRFARAITDRPIPDAEVRKAEREERKPYAPAHTPLTAVRAAASVMLYSQQMSADAKLLRDHHPELSTMIEDLAKKIQVGHEIWPQKVKGQAILSLKEAKKQSEFIMSRRSEILAGIQEIDEEISTIPLGKERSQLEHDASRIKLEAAEFIPDAVELIGHTQDNKKGYYHGLEGVETVEAIDGIGKDIKDQANSEVRKLARSVGVDPAKLISRFNKARPASQALADKWRKDELEDIQNNLTYKATTPHNKVDQLAQAAYDDLHRNALQTYRKAERELESQAARKKELVRIAKLIREGKQFDETRESLFQKTIKETLNRSELNNLERGQSDALKFVTSDIEQQNVLSKRYLEAEIQNADSARKRHLTKAISKIDRDAELALQRSSKLRQRDRGLDL